MQQIRVAVLGAGSWGTTVAALAARNTPTVVWSRRPDLAAQINDGHRNLDYLADYELPHELRATADLEEAVTGCDVLVMGVPSHSFRSTLEAVGPHLRPWVPVLSLTKGLEQGTRLRMSEIVTDVVPGHPVGVLTGPNLAKEILAGHAAASVIAMDDENVAKALQRIFQVQLFRVYINEDIVGCEMGGVLKNVIAIASGMADGLGAGDNTRAAVITRGLAEVTRLGVAMGGEVVTFAGLAGMGEMLARHLDADFAAIMFEHRFVVFKHDRMLTVDRRIGNGLAATPPMHDLPQKPRPAVGAAPDHQAVRADREVPGHRVHPGVQPREAVHQQPVIDRRHQLVEGPRPR